ncbi:MAG: hypothetical protein DCC58_07940 [Chloroflexi bacterium]|nr:MAG: hypothetical protein DCC58_07940 [Chloroflexota bacterium]
MLQRSSEAPSLMFGTRLGPTPLQQDHLSSLPRVVALQQVIHRGRPRGGTYRPASSLPEPQYSQ